MDTVVQGDEDGRATHEKTHDSARASADRAAHRTVRKARARSYRLGEQQGASLIDHLLDPLALESLTLDVPTFVCAEPGMGKSYLAQALADAARKRGETVRQYVLEGIPSDVACRRLVRTCRALAREAEDGAPIVAIFDGIAPPDESEVQREARALTRLAESGCAVLVCLRPEAEQLLEAVGGAQVLRNQDLLFRTPDGDADDLEPTGGIPALVVATREDVAAAPERRGDGPRYALAAEGLVESLLRTGLSDEERRLRLAFALLGHGTLEEIRAVCGRCDAEDLIWLERDVAILGVEAHEQRFCCHGLSGDELFARCLPAFQACVSENPSLTVRASSVLCARGDVRRSALVCKLCGSEQDIAMLGCRWGVPYVAVGELQLVQGALATAARYKLPESAATRLSEAACACVVESSDAVEQYRRSLAALRVHDALEHRLYDHVKAMMACRSVLRDLQGTPEPLDIGAENALGVSALEHARVLRLLFEGKFAEAYAALTNEVMLRRVETVQDGLLGLDLQLAAGACGMALDGRERDLVEQGADIFRRLPPGRLRRYQAAIDPLVEVMMGGRRGMDALEDGAAQAERAGDRLLHAALLTGAALGDLRGRALSRARIRARHAASLARTASAEYLASSAELVEALALELLGESGALETYCLRKGRPADLLMLGSMAARAANETVAGTLCPEVPLGTPLPRNALWAVNMLVYDCDGLSDEVRHMMPGSWTEQLGQARLRRHQCSGEVALAPELAAAAPAERGHGALRRGQQTEMVPPPASEQVVRINVLGGFSVRLADEQIPQSAFERRRSRDLVELLALAVNHRLQRYQALEAIWPDEDYYRGPRKLYEATGEARKLLGGRRRSINAVVSNRAQGSVALDRSLVSCDVDDFEREARYTLAEDRDDFWVLDHARQMCRLYGDGPDPHIAMLGDGARGRMGELEELYVDGLVAAGEAALRVGKTRLAVRYANDAHHLRPLREDAVIVQVQALRSVGRSFEVRELYQRFSQALLEARGVLPSLAVRQAVEHALGEGCDALSA